MSPTTVQFLVSLTIIEGRAAQLEPIVQRMVAGSRAEPGTLGYEWYLSSDRRTCRLHETYVDGQAALAHLKGPVLRDSVPQLLGVASLDRFEVYGDPGAEAAGLLAGFGAVLYARWHGLDG